MESEQNKLENHTATKYTLRQTLIYLLVVVSVFAFPIYRHFQSKVNTPYEMMTFAMDTLMDFSIYTDGDGDAMLIDIEQEIRRLERLFSVTIAESEVAKINTASSGVPIALSPETLSVLSYGLEMTNATQQAFQIGISPLVSLWGFTGAEEQKVPPQAEIDAVLSLIVSDDIALDLATGSVTLANEGMALDFGGIAKGYVADVVTDYLKSQGVANALFSLGGNISVIGEKPTGEAFQIAVANPLDMTDYVGVLAVSDCFIISSGGYQRYFEEDGNTYHHILDVATGYPAESDLLGVTIVSQNGMEADVLSTALFVLGVERSLALIDEMHGVEVIFVTKDGRVLATAGIAESFTFDGEHNEFLYEVLD